MNDLTELDFRKDIQINQDQLDIEWLRQADLVLAYGEALVEAKEYVRQCDQRVKVVRSELILEAKKGNAEHVCGVKKPSDSVCEAYYRTHPDHIAAVEAQIQAKKEEDLLQQTVYAIQNRKCSLEHLVRLMMAEYFTGPLEPHDLGDFSYDDFSDVAADFMKKAAENRKKTREGNTGRMAKKSRRRKA